MKFIKTAIFLIIFSGSTEIFCAPQEQDTETLKLIREFYTVYNTTWSAPISPAMLADKLLSLRIKYCSVNFVVELESDVDHDILINDQYTDVQHLKTLTVKKHPSLKNTFIVSYIAPFTNAANKPEEKKVVVYVTTMTGARGVKIASVCSP